MKTGTRFVRTAARLARNLKAHIADQSAYVFDKKGNEHLLECVYPEIGKDFADNGCQLHCIVQVDKKKIAEWQLFANEVVAMENKDMADFEQLFDFNRRRLLEEISGINFINPVSYPQIGVEWGGR